jgi:hypothetical protein
MSTQAPLTELSERWARARRAAAAAVIGRSAEAESEGAWLACAAEVDAVELHRRLFENSARLGQGFLRFHRRAPCTLEALPAVLTALDSPCLRDARWELVPGALKGTRRPCQERCDAATCDAWREAIDGLVVGLTGQGRCTRTASAGHGQAECVDVITDDLEHPLRFGVLPADILPVLESVQRFARRFKGTDVRFLGVCEGVLLYQLRTGACGEVRDNARRTIEDLLARRLPELGLRELSPRPVLDDSP